MDLGLKERDRISVLRQAYEGLVTVSGGAGVTPRHFRRLLRRFEAEGDAAAIHALRGRRSNRALPQEVRKRALAVALDPLYRDFGPTLLAEHLEIRCELRVSADTLRRWMNGGGPVGAGAPAGEAPQPPAAAGGAGGAGAVGQLGASLAGRQGGGKPGAHFDPPRRDEPPDVYPVRGTRQRGGEPQGDDGVPSAPRPPSGGVHGSRRALWPVAVEEEQAHRRDRYAERSEPLSRGALGPVLERTLRG